MEGVGSLELFLQTGQPANPPQPFEDSRDNMNKRTDYQRDYMRSYRAKQREAGATALPCQARDRMRRYGLHR